MSFSVTVLEQPFLDQTWNWSNDFRSLKIVKLYEVNGKFIAKLLASITENELDFTLNKTCGNMISIIQDLYNCSLTSILACNTLKFIKNEDDLCPNTINETNLTIQNKKICINFSDSDVENVDKFGYFMLTLPKNSNQYIQPLVKHQIDLNQMVHFWTQFCGFQNPQELQNVWLIKSMISTFQTINEKYDHIESNNQLDLGTLLDDSNDAFEMENNNEEINDEPSPIVEDLPIEKSTKQKSQKIDHSNLQCTTEGCDKKFNKYEAYRAHIRSYHHKIGSGVPCDNCGTMYQNFFFLKRHKRLQHDETPCKECGLRFHGSNELSRHIRKEHLTGNEHICELCGMGFKMKTYLKRHLRQQHPGELNFHEIAFFAWICVFSNYT